MSEFSYIPEAPTQSPFNNKGIFTPKDIYDLDLDSKWTQLGQLELLQTQTVSSAVVDFTSLQENIYAVHFFTFLDINVTTQTEFGYRLSDDGGSTFETGYEFANQRGNGSNSFDERKSLSQNSGRLGGDITTDAHSVFNGYMYLYNAGNSARWTYSTSLSSFIQTSTQETEIGSCLYPQTSVINGIRFGEGTGVTALTSGTISCYGIRGY